MNVINVNSSEWRKEQMNNFRKKLKKEGVRHDFSEIFEKVYLKMLVEDSTLEVQ